MTADDELEARPRRRRIPRLGRGARIIGILALLLLVALIALWTQRKPIAAGYVNRYLAGKGVPATYDIADLGLGRQRLTNVVLGDPARPDLVADWIELSTDIGFSGASVNKVRAGAVRLRGRLVNGTLSLGALDRLMPPPSGKPFALPALNVDVADARMRLETPQGLVGLKLSGRGQLDDGFSGNLAAVSDRLTSNGCVATGVAAAMKIGVAKAAPSFRGPARAAMVTCGATRVAGIGADLDVALSAALDRWNGTARLATRAVRHPLARTESIAGRVSFVGTAAQAKGSVKLDSGRFVSAEASGGRVGITGDYTLGTRLALEQGVIDWAGVALSPQRLAAVARLGTSAAGTPLAPLAAALARAGVAAGRSLDGEARFAASSDGPVRLGTVRLSAASGLQATLDRSTMRYDPRSGALQLGGTLSLRGGGFPSAEVTLAQAAPGAPVTGVARLLQPYAADGASLALTPLRFSATPGGNSRFTTQVALSGPLGDGRVDALVLPLDGLWNGRGRVVINPDCSTIGFQRLAVSGLVLRPTQLRLCPINGALVSLNGTRLSGGAAIAAPRLVGALGSSPLTLAASNAQLRLSDMAFGLSRVAVRIGAPARVTRLDFGALDGRISGSTVMGSFAGGGGQIGNVPLILSAAAGTWGLKGGVLDLDGAMAVSDAAPEPRFNPLAAEGVTLRLANGRITAQGRLMTPGRTATVATVDIVHDLSKGSGTADLIVPSLAFADKGLQPDDLTRLTVGVIANVVGTVTGEGHIRWSSQAVTSDGVFRTGNMDLAAALGPVSGIATEIRFTDLLALQSAPGQVATIKTINTGIVVTDGVIRYQTLPEARVRVEEGRWPFAGGSLVLEPTLLDFSAAQERRMTLTVTGMEAAKFLSQFEFENLDATGVFDGQLPMIFDSTGGRVDNGRLTVRPGGGTIAYLGEVSKENLGFWGNYAFQALKSLRYRSLDLVMNGPLSGEMVTEVRFAGVSQGAGTKRNFLFDRLQRLPLVFNVRIKAPFRGLFDSARSFYDPSRLVERNLPALIEERDRQAKPPPATPPAPAAPPPVQPQESETVP
ncbi:YdbH domain-containing protein [Sphingomonas hylomeconis]|uniref:YdbH domain-containing protein n=1 Tax=Sphingomonas hylomeconis TaxID=1395958 RepID=UPI0021BB335A|nr:YdbH domain-containing protein [Sphingomonas hylomeconis]